MAKHRLADRRAAPRVDWTAPMPTTVYRMVDLPTGTIHLLPRDADANRWGRYPAVCGVEVFPASLTDPGRRYCRSCRSTSSVPSQRSDSLR